MSCGKMIKGSEIIGKNIRPDTEYRLMIYDFKRPDKFSKDQIRTLAVMHETFARLITTGLSAMLRQLIQVNVSLVDQMTYQEFIQTIPNHPTTLAIVEMPPLKGAAILEIDPTISFAIIDRIFGGKGRSAGFTRDHTDIEFVVLEGIINRILHHLGEAWSTIIDLKPSLGGIETNSMFAQIVPPSEMVVLVTLQAKVGEAEGMINICVPFLTLEPLIPKLSAQYWYSSIRGERKQRIPPSTLGNLKVEARVFFEAEDLSLKDLGILEKNSLIKLPHFDLGKAFLLAGEYPVIKLETVGPKTGNNFEFIVESIEPSGESKRIILGSLDTGKEKLEELNRLILVPIEGLKHEIQDRIQELNNSILKIRNKQDELSDQFYFATQEIKPDEMPSVARRKPFGFVRTTDVELLHTLISQEHPQTMAMILSYFDSDLAAHILSKLDETLCIDVVERIATMDRIPPEVLKKVEKVVEEKITTSSADEYTTSGGVDTAAEILNISSRSLEKQVIESLEKKNPSLAEEIKASMFVFEDMMLLDRNTIQAVLKNIERHDLALALKAVDERVKEKIFSTKGESERVKLQSDLEEIGRVKLSDVEAAQQRIVNVIRTLEESGAIVIAREGETLID